MANLNPLVRFIPLCVAILMPITFTISFTMARTAGHITGFNYISDTGTVPIESCVFGQLLNVIGLLLAYSSYYIYLLMDEPNNLERIAYKVGIVSGIGASIVANFQELNVLVVHGIGALMAFGGGVSYLWLRTFASGFQRKQRWPICALASVSLLACAVGGGVAVLEYTDVHQLLGLVSYLSDINGAGATGHIDFPEGYSRAWAPRKTLDHIIKWEEDDGGYAAHAVSVIGEWMTALSLILYMISHYFEMSTLINASILP